MPRAVPVAQGLNLVLGTLARAGVTRVGFEDESGLNVAALAASGARAVVLTPAHQWPTGVVLSPQRRLQLIEWAAGGRP